MSRRERAKLQGALTLSNTAEGNLVVYFEVTYSFNRDTGHEEVAVDKDIDFLSCPQPILLVYITDCHAAFADIHNPCNLLMGLLGNSNDQVWNFVALMFPSFTVGRVILHVTYPFLFCCAIFIGLSINIII